MFLGEIDGWCWIFVKFWVLSCFSLVFRDLFVILNSGFCMIEMLLNFGSVFKWWLMVVLMDKCVEVL